MKNISLKAFTLAEILLTLLVIGVVASIVVPQLINDAQDAELKVAWKKQFANLSAVSRLILLDNAGSFENITYKFNHDQLKNLFIAHLNTSKICGGDYVVRTTYANCWHDQYGQLGVTKFFNKNDLAVNQTPLGAGSAGVITADGTFLLFTYQDNTCKSSDSLFTSTNNEGLSNLCGWITVDVNGFKGPNQVGKDIFGLWVAEKNLIPYGTKNLKNTCTTTSTGMGCSAKYLYQ